MMSQPIRSVSNCYSISCTTITHSLGGPTHQVVEAVKILVSCDNLSNIWWPIQWGTGLSNNLSAYLSAYLFDDPPISHLYADLHNNLSVNLSDDLHIYADLVYLMIYMPIPLAPKGVLAHGSVHAWPSARPPIDTSGIFSAHMSEGGGG